MVSLLARPTIARPSINSREMFIALKQDIAPNTAKPLAQCDHNVNIVNHNGFYLLGNICPHQKSRIACESSRVLKCPYHGLEYQLSGQGQKHSYQLPRTECYSNQTMLLTLDFDYKFPIDTEFMTLVQHREEILKASAHIVMDVFLDIDHIPVAHAGVYDKIGMSTVDDLQYDLYTGGSVQSVPMQNSNYVHPQDQKHALSACWMAIYPGTMIEWQPGALFVTVAQSHQQGCKVQIFQYRDTRYSLQDWANNCTVWETAWSQDRALAENIVELACDNLNSLQQHFRQWLQKHADSQ